MPTPTQNWAGKRSILKGERLRWLIVPALCAAAIPSGRSRRPQAEPRLHASPIRLTVHAFDDMRFFIGGVSYFTTLIPSGYGHAAVWRPGELIDLGTLGGDFSEATAVNDRGWVVGYAAVEDKHQARAFLFRPPYRTGRMLDLGTLGGGASYSSAINHRGDIVSAASTGPRPGNPVASEHAFLWTSGRMTDLGTLGGTESEARAVDERGRIVGSADVSSRMGGLPHAFLYARGRMRDLGALGGGTSQATAINDAGWVVGSSRPRGGQPHAILIRPPYIRMIDLGTLGGRSSEAVAVNDSGCIVGSSYTASGDVHAFLWKNGRMEDLGGRFGRALAIDQHGAVVIQAEERLLLRRNGKTVDLGARVDLESRIFRVREHRFFTRDAEGRLVDLPMHAGSP